jgi:hypothetical protein
MRHRRGFQHIASWIFSTTTRMCPYTDLESHSHHHHRSLALHHDAKQFPVNTILPLAAHVLQTLQTRLSTRLLWMRWVEGLVNPPHHRNFPWTNLLTRNRPWKKPITCLRLVCCELLRTLSADGMRAIHCRRSETCSTVRRASMDESRLIEVAPNTGKLLKRLGTRSSRGSQVCKQHKTDTRTEITMSLYMIRHDLRLVSIARLLLLAQRTLRHPEENHKTTAAHNENATGA